MQKYKEMIEVYKDDPVGWIEKFISFDGLNSNGLTWEQKETANNLVLHRFLSVTDDRGKGKTAIAAMLILWFLSTHYMSKVPATAPNYNLLHDVLFREIAKWLERCAFKDMFKLSRGKLEVVNHKDWFCIARTVNSGVNLNDNVLLGFFADNIMIVVDEAENVPAQIFPHICSGMSKEDNYVLLMASDVSRHEHEVTYSARAI